MPQSNDKLVVRKVIPASREELFAAWTNPASMAAWMCPGNDITHAEVKLDVRVGGKFRILMKGKNKDHDHTGEYRMIKPPAKLVFTWNSEHTGGTETVVTVEFLERGKQTEVVLTHEGFGTAQAVKEHTGGWTEILEHLADSYRTTKVAKSG